MEVAADPYRDTEASAARMKKGINVKRSPIRFSACVSSFNEKMNVRGMRSSGIGSPSPGALSAAGLSLVMEEGPTFNDVTTQTGCCKEEPETHPLTPNFPSDSGAILPGASSEEPSSGDASFFFTMEERSCITDIWILTVELICLLTGETFPVTSGDHVTMAVSPPPSWTLERITMQKIQKISNLITELLIGEVSIRCQEVTACLAMEEQEHMEENQELYTDTKMEDQSLPQSPEGRPHPLYTQDSTQEGHLTPHHYQTDVKEEELEVEVSIHTGVGIKEELYSSYQLTPERPPLGEDGAEAEETGVRSDQRCLGEESSSVIDEGRHHMGRYNTEHPDISSDLSTDNNDTVERLSSSKCDKNKCDKIKKTKKSLQLLRHEGVASIAQKPPTEDNRYSCSECGKSFPLRSHLLIHARLHPGENRFSCFICRKHFPWKADLLTHQIVFHPSEAAYACCKCGIHFATKSRLIRHERIHTGKKLFSSYECGKSFLQKSNLLTHERVHTGEKPFSCSECGKGYSTKSNLNQHKQIHVIEKLCSSQKSIIVTPKKRIHTGEKPYSCSECEMSFPRKSCLIAHEKVHARKKPYSCS